LHKAFWDSPEEQLTASPPDYTGAIQLLQEIRDHCFFGQALLSLLLPRHHQLRSQIEEALDMELIRQEADHEALDIRGLTMFVLGTMPVWDEEVQGLQALTDPAHLLRELFRVLGPMKTDMLTFTVQSIRTRLQDHIIHYERKKFQELLDKLPNRQDRTREWLCKPAAEASASSSQPPPHPAVSGSPAVPSLGAISSSTAVPSLKSVLNQGYMNLLCWEPGQKEYPTFMDQARLQGVQAQVNQLTIIGAVLLVTSSMCESTLFCWPGFVARLKVVTKVLLEGLSCTWRDFPPFHVPGGVQGQVGWGFEQPGLVEGSQQDKCISLKGQIKSIVDKGNAVWHDTEQRIHSFLSLFISSDGQNSQKDFPKGLDPIQEELLEVRRRFGSVIHHNRQVFGPYYSGILKKLLLPKAESDWD
ncbi:TCP11 protein, partial [Rynchops niger]|nr:TCP11 protein [Rynchops niger]